MNLSFPLLAYECANLNDNYVEDEDYDDYGEEDENLLPRRHAVARSAMNITTATNVRPCFANDTHM